MKATQSFGARRRHVNADPHPDLIDAIAVTRFWTLIDQSSDCWEWQGDLDKDGYGVFFWKGRKFGAHQLALSFTSGEMKLPGLDTCHSCDNPACCNPDHIRFDTRRSNVADMHKRGRAVSPAARLTAEQVVTIRERRAHGATQKTLAEQFGLSPAYVSEIVRGITWKDAGGPIQAKYGQRVKAS